jgi:hypothetical protein
MMSSSDDENSATADRVEKKSIDEAIASFAMLVRIECVFIVYVCSCAFLCECEERRMRQPFFCFFFVYFFFFFA